MSRPAFERSERYIIALDVGTSAIHCLLTNSLGRPLTTASVPMRYFTPDGCSYVAREFNPDVVLDALGRLVGTVLNSAKVNSEDVSAIGITSQRQGVVFLDNREREIYCGPNIDLRAIFEGAKIDEELGREIYATTGHFPSMLLAPARLRWFHENSPTIYDSTHKILTIAGWIAYRLTGVIMSEPSLEAEAGLLDVTTMERCPSLMGKLGVDLSILPDLLLGSASFGTLSQIVASDWGLKPDIPVAVAGPDTQCGLLGMGLVEEGQVGAVMGWSGALQAITSIPRLDEAMRTWVGCYPFGYGHSRSQDATWVAESNLGDTGNAYRWLKDTILGSDASFEEAERLAQEAGGTSEGVTAFLGPGPVSSLKAGLKMGGLFFPTPLSFQEATRGQLFRAALENIVYSIKANLSTLEEVTGHDTQVLYLGGGMSGSRTITTMLANTLGFPVRRSTTPQISARGTALAAAVSTNSSPTLKEMAEVAADDCEEIEPGTASEIAQYQEYYQQWLHLYKRLEWE